MSVEIDDTDISILRSIVEDGRKSFRAISREAGESMPTVKARYENLVNMGIIKSVKAEIDLSKINTYSLRHFSSEDIKRITEQQKSFYANTEGAQKVIIQCECCGGPVKNEPQVLEYAELKRFFCCIGCKNHYKETNAQMIQSILKRYREMQRSK